MFYVLMKKTVCLFYFININNCVFNVLKYYSIYYLFSYEMLIL